jgi:hypothetical protein
MHFWAGLGFLAWLVCLGGVGRLIEPPQKRCPFFFTLFWVLPYINFLDLTICPRLEGIGKPKKEKRFEAKLGFGEGVSLVGCPNPFTLHPTHQTQTPNNRAKKKTPNLESLFVGCFLWN